MIKTFGLWLNENQSKEVDWVKPSKKQLELEFHVESELKGNNYFKSKENFLIAVENGKTQNITKEFDNKIGYRSHTESYEELLDLIKSYRSYPEFKNEKTLKLLYKKIQNGDELDMPIILHIGNRFRVFSGNTRLDIAFQLNKKVKALIIKA